MEPENLQSVLQEAGIQADMKNLENPTEEFMTYLITEYLNICHFDGYEISKSTPDQLECLSCPDSAMDAIKVINLYSALSSFCNEIFLKDFYLTDITSPGPKRARRQIKILFNFLAYVRQKMVDNEMAFIELDNRQREIQETINETSDIIAKTGAMINDRENKLELRQQLRQEIDEITFEIENNNKKTKKLEECMKSVMEQHSTEQQKCNSLKAKAIQLHKVTTDLQSKIVKSPEEYATRTKELKKVLEVKKEERQLLNDTITRKKQQIKNNENAKELVKDINDKFSSSASETYKQLKETSEKLDYVKKELDILKSDIQKWSKIDGNDSSTISHNEDLKGHEQLVFELNNKYSDKEREFNSQKVTLEELKIELGKKKAALENELKTILSLEEDNFNLTKQYKEYIDKELAEENYLRKSIITTMSRTG